ncbi:hypothetical protein [Tolypothrix sp. NIES-4075]|uniref:hypothetical protein n=1 Tax=Tolypothrix sp. NIES-4075 TaxID=2005459 RepID=UPI00135CF571|nr:hypothetical protein [Tolypothrix sp. NIES-4075]
MTRKSRRILAVISRMLAINLPLLTPSSVVAQFNSTLLVSGGYFQASRTASSVVLAAF